MAENKKQLLKQATLLQDKSKEKENLINALKTDEVDLI